MRLTLSLHHLSVLFFLAANNYDGWSNGMQVSAFSSTSPAVSFRKVTSFPIQWKRIPFYLGEGYPSPSSFSSSSLGVSIGIGPEEEQQQQAEGDASSDIKATEEAEEKEVEVVEEPDHELYRKDRMSNLDTKCDEWFAALLGDEDSMFLGSLSKDMRNKLVTPAELKQEDIVKDRSADSWTPYYSEKLPGSIIYPAYGLETYGLPIPRRGAEAWRHFDVAGMVDRMYSNSPLDAGKELDIEKDQLEKYKSTLLENGSWVEDDACTARLVYINGRFAPGLSKETESIRNLSSKDFADPNSLGEDILERLAHLPDGFTDRLCADVPSGETEFLTSYKTLSGPDHSVGEPTTQYAINSQQGHACFAALNTVRAGAVAFVEIPAGADAKSDNAEDAADDDTPAPKPVIIINAQTADGGADAAAENGVAYHTRTLVIAGEKSNASVVQSYVDLDGENDEQSKPKFHNGYTQIYVKNGAHVTHSYLEESGGIVTGGVEQGDENLGEGEVSPREIESRRAALSDTHLGTIDVHLTGDDARYSGTLMEFGGSGRSRIAISASLLRPGAHADINGFVLAGGAQRADMRTNIHHIGQATTSRQNQKNMVGGRATASFRGRIRVEQSAQQTDSEQLARTILLSDRSRIWAIPSLEIIADDVTCTHGATVSDLSEEELFYLRSRGVDRTSARNILMYAFVEEVGQSVDEVVRGHVDDENGLRKRVIERLENLVPQGERSVKGEFQSV
uniref:SUF system FeS cluster assembly SufBD core domain-containing protein n=1 Tax=Ditylum brightwellii TaxID=49249 RepID=A0A7S4R4P8_9STRA